MCYIDIVEEIDGRRFSGIDCCFFMEKNMERIVFKNDKDAIALKLKLRKEIIHEIVEDCKCRDCPKLKKHSRKHGVQIEIKRY